jgi:hypothetical protein
VLSRYFPEMYKKQGQEGTIKTNRKVRMRLNIGRPDSAKACTEVSPSMPVLVKKVEYRIKMKPRKENR